MAPRFFPDKDFGTITPPYRGATYDQGGRYFAADGTYLFSQDGTDESVDHSAGASAPVDASIVTPQTLPTRTEDDAASAAETVETIDLIGWAKKEKNYPFFVIKKTVKDALPDADVTSTATVIAALIAAEIIAPDEAAR